MKTKIITIESVKKISARLLCVLSILMMSVSLSSCGDDDDDDDDGPSGGSYSIVGSWSCSHHYYGGTDYYFFNSNGTYSWSCPGNWPNSESGNYTYSSGLLTLVSNSGVSRIYLVRFSNKNTFIMTDEDGDSYTYTKAN